MDPNATIDAIAPPVSSNMHDLLCVLLQKYCAATGLEFDEATDLLRSNRLTPAQRHWLSIFVDLWDATVELPS